MLQSQSYTIPRTLPAYLEIAPGVFIDGEDATAAEWKKATQFAADRRVGRRTIHAMARLADTLGIPDDIPLLPRLRALASANVTVTRLNRPIKPKP